MRCESEFHDVNYSSDLFCRTCGMDVGLNPIKVRQKDTIRLYCCEGCAKQ